jgi:hypothetical protein
MASLNASKCGSVIESHFDICDFNYRFIPFQILHRLRVDQGDKGLQDGQGL